MSPSLEIYEALLGEQIKSEDKRLTRLLEKIYSAPEQVTQSVLKHLNTDTAVWHNSLTFLAKKKSEPMASLMVLMADALREDKADELFSIQELTDIASMSRRVWLRGIHEDKTNLRLNAAIKLGEMLCDPQRQSHVQAVLKDIQSTAVVPALPSQEQCEDTRKEGLDAVYRWGQNVTLNADPKGPGGSPALTMAGMAAEGGSDHYLQETDWRAVELMISGEDPNEGNTLLRAILGRLEMRMIEAASARMFHMPAAPSKGPRP